VGSLSRIGVAPELDLPKQLNRSNGHRGCTNDSTTLRALCRDCSVTSPLITERESAHWKQFAHRFFAWECVRYGHEGMGVPANSPDQCCKPVREMSLIR